MWIGTTFALIAAEVVTVAVALTIPAAFGACIVAASILAAVAIVIVTLEIIAKRQTSWPLPKEMFEGFNETTKLAIFKTDFLSYAEPEQLEILRQFNPEAQVKLLQARIFAPDTSGLIWESDELNHFLPEEIQLLINYFGQKFAELRFLNYIHRSSIQFINVANLANIKCLFLSYLENLITVEGLEKCVNCRLLSVIGCGKLDRDDFLAKLLQIPCADICLHLYQSNLMIETLDELKNQLNPGGYWGEFLNRHPHASFYAILKKDNCHPLSYQDQDLEGNRYYYLQKNWRGDSYNLVLTTPEGLLPKDTSRESCARICGTNIIFNCTGSYLTIDTFDELKNQLAPDEYWDRFLKRNPYAAVIGILRRDRNHPLDEDTKRLDWCRYFRLRESDGGDTYDLVPKTLSEILQNPYLYQKLAHFPHPYLYASDLRKCRIETTEELLAFIHCLNCVHSFQGILFYSYWLNSKAMEQLSELNLANFPKLERVKLYDGANIKFLHNLSCCHELQILEIGPKLTNIDVGQVKADILCLHSLNRLFLGYSGFVEGPDGLTNSDIERIFNQNQNLQLINLYGTEVTRL